jgi:hypothetical protein
MKALLEDTTPEAEAVLLGLLREAPVWKRLQMVDHLHETLKLLILADLRRQNPTADEAEIQRRLVARCLNREDVIAAFGWDPKLAGYAFIEKS